MNTCKIQMGFLTGQEKFGTNKWFSVTRTFRVESVPEGILKVIDEVYQDNDDICADLVFFIEYAGEILSQNEIYDARKQAFEVMLNR